MAGNKVYVGDLADNVEEEEIKQAFQKIGEVTEVELKSNFAFVHMADSNDVDEAINQLHQTEIAGKVVRVEKPRPRRPRGRGMGGGGGFGGRSDACFNCGMPGHWQRECRRPPAGGGGYRGAYGGGGGGGGFGGGGYGMTGYGGMGARGGPPQGGRGGMMPYSNGGGAGAGGDRGGRGRGGFGGGPGGRGRGRGNCFRCNSPSHWSRECPQENQQGFQ